LLPVHGVHAVEKVAKAFPAGQKFLNGGGGKGRRTGVREAGEGRGRRRGKMRSMNGNKMKNKK